MIHIVTAENRTLFHHALMQMHRHRKAIFVDELRWPLPAESGLEIDQYDSAAAIYLIDAEAPRARVSASLRLLPTDRPHLLGDLFADLCVDPPPAGPDVWEITRLCPAPDVQKGEDRRRIARRMIAAVMETALLFGVERLVFVAHAALAALVEDAGWRVRTLGPGRGKGRHRLVAMAAEVDAEGLRRVRAALALNGPVTRFSPGAIAHAA